MNSLVARLKRKGNQVHPGGTGNEAGAGESEHLLSQKEINWGFRAEKKRFLIDPNHPMRHSWDWFVILLVFTMAIAIPFELGFQPDLPQWYIILGYIIDSFFGIDIIINFFTTFKHPINHFYINDYREVARNYLRGWFALDVISVFPFEIFAISASGSTWFKMLKSVRLLRINKVIKQIKNITTSEASNVIRLSWMVILFCLVIHWTGCFFAGAAIYWSDVDDNWIYYYESADGGNRWESRKSSRYVAALYWSAMSVTTVGYGDIVPQNDIERLVNSITMVIGALIYAVIFGNISLYIANLNRDETNYQEISYQIRKHMKDISLPKKLQGKVLSYHDYVWQKNRGVNDNELLGDIPQRVQVEVAVLIHGRMIKSNAVFADAPESFINAAALALRYTCVLPNEFVFQQGEIAESIFWIARGQVGVFRDEFGSMTVLSGIGSFFGEIPLFLEKQINEEGQDEYVRRESSSHTLSNFRLHSVRGYAYCDLWKMDYDSFTELMQTHPSIGELMVLIASERVKQTRFYDDELMIHKIGLKFIREKQKRKRQEVVDTTVPVNDLKSQADSNGMEALSSLERTMANISQKLSELDAKATSISNGLGVVSSERNINSIVEEDGEFTDPELKQ